MLSTMIKTFLVLLLHAIIAAGTLGVSIQQEHYEGGQPAARNLQSPTFDIKDQSSAFDERRLQNYGALAFLCDENNVADTSDDARERNQKIRVCFETNDSSQQELVTILTVNNFRFERKNKEGRKITQDAVDAGSSNERSSLDCPGGDSYCAVETNLRDQFYDSDGEVDAFGLVVLQNGVGRRLTVPLQGTLKQHREAQDVIAVVPVGLSFQVEDGLDKGFFQEDGDSLKDIWNDQESSVQGLIVVALILLLLLCCCCCAGCILWKRCCADVPGVWRIREVEVDDVEYEEPHSKYTKEEFSESHSIDEYDIDEEDTRGRPDASTIATDYDAIENGDPEDPTPFMPPKRKSKLLAITQDGEPAKAKRKSKLLAITQDGEPAKTEKPSFLAITQYGEPMVEDSQSIANDAPTIASDYNVTQERASITALEGASSNVAVSNQRDLNSKSPSKKNRRRKSNTKANSTRIRNSKRGSMKKEEGSGTRRATMT